MRSYFQYLLLILITGVPFLMTAATSQTGDGGQSFESIPNPTPLSQFDLPELMGISINLEEWCVDVDAYICLKKGVLELIACTKASKEHESIVAIESTAKHVHTALLLLGAEAGSTRSGDAQKPAAAPRKTPPLQSAPAGSLPCERSRRPQTSQRVALRSEKASASHGRHCARPATSL